mmetsp:Transcript_81447/g.252789  ORF Transcript_81447/g.252789 Transcript_81447/m.252789 type:complete len:359 (+) Transcript_81447:419-1495(+)
MQAVRFAIHGFMPNIWGGLHGQVPLWSQNWWLCSVAAACCVVGLTMRRNCAPEGAEEEEEEDPRGDSGGFCLRAHHFLELATDFLLFSCSWALLFAFQGIFVASDPSPDGHTNIMLTRTAVALMSSGWAFIVISFLDSINDRLYNSSMNIHREAQGVIASVGMMVGFAWERCFHHAFEVSAMGMSHIIHGLLDYKTLHTHTKAGTLTEVPGKGAGTLTEVVMFMLGCAGMSLVTTLAALWYIVPRSIEATHRAKLEKSRQHEALVLKEEPAPPPAAVAPVRNMSLTKASPNTDPWTQRPGCCGLFGGGCSEFPAPAAAGGTAYPVAQYPRAQPAGLAGPGRPQTPFVAGGRGGVVFRT